MSTFIRPTGPEPSGVYWRRRLVLVVVVLVVVLGLAWLLLRPGDSGADGQALPAPSPSMTSPSVSSSPPPSDPPASGGTSPKPTSSAPNASATGSAKPTSPKPTAKPTTPKPSSPDPTGSSTPGSPTADDGTCSDAQIGVSVSTDSATYAAGSTPQLTMRIANISDRACLRDVGSRANELTIAVMTDGVVGRQIWSSDDCIPAGTSDVAEAPAGQAFLTPSIRWNGRATPVDCKGQGTIATPGTYAVIGRNGEVLSAPVPFDLN